MMIFSLLLHTNPIAYVFKKQEPNPYILNNASLTLSLVTSTAKLVSLLQARLLTPP